MKYEEESLLNAIGHCIGYGPENAKYFFWGLEEKEENTVDDKERDKVYKEKFNKLKKYYTLTNEEIYSKCKECEKIDINRLKKNRTYPRYVQLYNEISGDDITKYQLGSEKISVVVGNPNPFAKFKTRDNYLPDESKWLNSKKLERDEYICNYLSVNAQDGMVFCFGQIDVYKELFQKYCSIKFNTYSFDEIAHDNNKYYKSSNLNLYILYHPVSGKLSINQISELAKKIKNKRK
jgi:hypothetical protein